MFEVGLFTFGFFHFTREKDELSGEAAEEDSVGGGSTNSSQTNNGYLESFLGKHSFNIARVVG